MPIRLSAKDADFGERFAAFLDTKREASADVESIVRAIIADVAERGDRALIDYTKQFDRVDLAKLGMKVTAADIDAAADSIDRKTLAALELARDRVEAHHKRQLPKDDLYYGCDWR
jgi:histidinol dehydrogenase